MIYIATDEVDENMLGPFNVLNVTFLNDFSQRPNKTIIIISHYAQLIKALNVQSVAILGKTKVKQGDIKLAYDVLDNGFGDYV